MPGLYLIAKALGDIKLLGQVRTGGILRDIRRQGRELERIVCCLDSKKLDLFEHVSPESIANGLDALKSFQDLLYNQARIRSLAMSGDMALEVPAAVEVTAAALNAAAAGAIKKHFLLSLKTTQGEYHDWASMQPVLTPAEAAADAQIGVPTITGTPVLADGRVAIELTLDTDAGATKTYQAGTKSIGQVTCVAKANFVDGETVTLEDALGVSKIFEFDVAGDGVSGTNVQVDISGATTAADVAVILQDAINGEAGLAMTAVATAADVDLTQDDALAAGDTTITKTVADAGFVVTSFTGGVDRDSVSCQCQVRADDKWLDHAVAAVTMTYNVV